MSAGIRVDSGISVGTRYWIDRPVLRIGSDPQCDISLPSTELEPHAVTLEFREGAYRVYNRCAAPINIGTALVKPGANAPWRADETIQLPGDLRISLEIEGDPRPSPQLASRLDDGIANGDQSLPLEGATGEAAGEAAKKSKSSLIQMAIIGVCVLAVAGLLMMKKGGGETTAPDRPTFNDIVQASLTKDEAHRAVVRRLQYAQAALVRGNSALARQRFLKLRDQLVNHVDSLDAKAQDDAKSVLSYVEYRLGRL